MGQRGPKHLGVSSFYNSIVNLIQLQAFVALNYSSSMVRHGKENVKYLNNLTIH